MPRLTLFSSCTASKLSVELIVQRRSDDQIKMLDRRFALAATGLWVLFSLLYCTGTFLRVSVIYGVGNTACLFCCVGFVLVFSCSCQNHTSMLRVLLVVGPNKRKIKAIKSLKNYKPSCTVCWYLPVISFAPAWVLYPFTSTWTNALGRIHQGLCSSPTTSVATPLTLAYLGLARCRYQGP